MIKIFISHSWADKVKPQFGQVYQELDGYDIWIDKTELQPGKSLNKNIREAIKEMEVVLVLWSKNAAKSDSVQYEIQTAVELQKTILPCIIDDHPLTDSPHLKDMLYIDLRDIKNTANLALGWMRVKYFLTDFYIDKISRRVNDYEPEQKQKVLGLLDDLKQMQGDLKNQISLLHDTLHRIASGAEDRNQNNPYAVNMLNRLITDLKSDNASTHENQVVDFLQFSKEILSRYPNDDSVSVKIREGLMLERIHQLDPNEENEKLMFLKAGLSQLR